MRASYHEPDKCGIIFFDFVRDALESAGNDQTVWGALLLSKYRASGYNPRIPKKVSAVDSQWRQHELYLS
jgi:hypothetical protein